MSFCFEDCRYAAYGQDLCGEIVQSSLNLPGMESRTAGAWRGQGFCGQDIQCPLDGPASEINLVDACYVCWRKDTQGLGTERKLEVEDVSK